MAGARLRGLDISGFVQASLPGNRAIGQKGAAEGAGAEALLGGVARGIGQIGQNRRESKVRAEAKAERTELRDERATDREWKRQMEIAELTGMVPDYLIRNPAPATATAASVKPP